jgi:hypothetical protein
VDDQPPPTEAARFFVLAFGLVCFAIAGVLYVAAGPEYLVGVGVISAIGAIYMGLFVFASTAACQSAALLLTFGTWGWW